MGFKTYLWDGVVTGDATIAPYDKISFNRWFSAPEQNMTGCMVVPGYLDDLLPEVVSYSRVIVHPGAARMNDYIFINDAPINVTIKSNSEASVYRYDRIVLELDTLSQTIRVNLVTGVESAVFPPSLPALTQNANIWQEEIGRAYIDSESFLLDARHFEDKRKFLRTYWSMQSFPDYNLIRNSEFMAVGPVGKNLIIPLHWTIYPFPTAGTYDPTTKLAPMSRGQAMDIVDGGIRQIMLVSPEYHTYSLRGLIEVVSGTVDINLYGVLDDETTVAVNSIEMQFRETGSVIDFNGTVTFDEDDVRYLRFEATTDSGQYYLGQVICVTGYHTGPFRPFSETLLLADTIIDADWFDDAKSDGRTDFVFPTDFSFWDATVVPGTKAIIINAKARDSGAAGVAATLDIRSLLDVTYGRVDLTYLPTDRWATVQVTVPVNVLQRTTGVNTPGFRVVINASGAGTMDVNLQIVGIIT